MELYKTTNSCRSCNSPNLKQLVEFGPTTIADKLLKENMLNGNEKKVPLSLVTCQDCSLVQIKEEVNPVVLFQDDYPYYSSISESLISHFEKSAMEIIASRELDKNSFVVEAASNDGYMLQHFVRKGIKVLGIDPASGPGSVAEQKGIKTIVDFFGISMAESIVRKHGKVDVFLANNVLAHVPDLNGFVEGIRKLLKDNGIAVIEAPYLLDLVGNCAFDTIYHQHLCYFSLTALQSLFNRHGLYLNDLKHVELHGGTIRMFIEPFPNPSYTVLDYMKQEQNLDLHSPAFYKRFVERINFLKEELLDLLEHLRAQGKSIAGYGAAAKANTLLSYFGIGKNYLEYIADASKYKQGLYFSGNHLPIVPPSRLTEDRPDYVLLLAWNFSDEIIKQQKEYRDHGGKFIVPIPEIKIV